MTNKTNKPLTSQQCRIVDATGWHSAGVSLDFALDRLDWLESVLQDCELSLFTLQNRIMEENLADEEVYNALYRVRKTLTDALRE